VQDTWREYLMEGGCLGIFMLSACLFTAWLEYPHSGLYVAHPFWRTALIGVAMGATLLLIVHTPWGKQSGAHMNPAVTLTFLSLGKITPWRAAGYIAGQFAGGIAGVIVAFLIAGEPVMRVRFAVTQPGSAGVGVAFAAEALISFLMMTTVLSTSNSRRFSRWTPYFAAALVALFITVEARYSGMSMNPARTVASAVAAGQWTAIWVYFTAPVLGMLLAAAFYRLGPPRASQVYCAKLHHHNRRPCSFNCNHGELHAQ
jgi:aquaporin Z